MSPLRCPGASPRTVAEPALNGRRPRRMRRSVDLPAPFGPSTATSSPGSIVRSTSLQIGSTADLGGGTAQLDGRRARSSPGRPVERGDQAPRARRLPLLEARSSRARASRSRSPPGCARPGRGVCLVDLGGDVLAVEHPDLDLCRRSCRSTVSLSRMLTSPPSATALAKPGGREEPQAEARAERLEDALAVADGDAGEAAVDLGAQRVVARECLGLEPALLRREVAGVAPGRRGRRRR